MSLGFLILLFSCSNEVDYAAAQWLEWDKDTISYFPKEHWQKYKKPEDAGWSTDKLQEAKHFWEESESSAFLVIYDGAILVSWGEVDRRFLLHSARKSIYNGLFGIAADEGELNSGATLGELGVTDIFELTTLEKTAKLEDLFRFRSGVFIRGSGSLVRDYPERGSVKPGEKWFYNNWDMNVATAVLEQETKTSSESMFEARVANPLMMEHFRVMDIDEVYEENRSRFPSHPMKMSALDLARFGLLYLNNGKWKDQQIISSEWIETSTFPHSKLDDKDFGQGSDYGYNWWVSDDHFKRLGMYSARGILGQRLRVMPVADLVVVNLVNSYKRHNFKEEDQLELLDKILMARVSRPADNPELIELETTPILNTISDSIASRFLGKYTAPYKFDPELPTMDAVIEYRGNELIVDFQYGNPYKMIKIAENTYIMEDLDLIEEKRFPMKFFIDKKGKAAFRTELAFVLDKVTFRKNDGLDE